jgi:hypothetical protein
MADPEAILTAHYEAVREEEMERIRLRDNYLVWYATAAGAAGGIYLQDQAWWGLLLAIPILTLVTGLLYSHTDVNLGSLSYWLRRSYSAALEEYRKANCIEHQLPHWDGSEVHQRFVKSSWFGIRYVSVSAVLAVVGAASVVMLGPHVVREFTTWATSVRLVLSLGVALGAGLPLWAWKTRAGQL